MNAENGCVDGRFGEPASRRALRFSGNGDEAQECPRDFAIALAHGSVDRFSDRRIRGDVAAADGGNTTHACNRYIIANRSTRRALAMSVPG
jgi:hypothetical protein